jgi:hypothetical protein
MRSQTRLPVSTKPDLLLYKYNTMNKDNVLLAEAYQRIYKNEYLLEFDMGTFTQGLAHAMSVTGHAIGADAAIQQLNAAIGASVLSAIKSVGMVLAWAGVAGIGTNIATNIVVYFFNQVCENAKKEVAVNTQKTASSETAANVGPINTPEMLKLRETDPDEYYKKVVDFALESGEGVIKEFKRRKLPLDLTFIKKRLDDLAIGIKDKSLLITWAGALAELLHQLHAF